jgi:hypothetical protein
MGKLWRGLADERRPAASKPRAAMEGVVAPCEAAAQRPRRRAEAGGEQASGERRKEDTDRRENTDESGVSWCVRFLQEPLLRLLEH